METVNKKCYQCGQEYYYGTTHSCPTNWNTQNCEKIENKIQNIYRKKEINWENRKLVDDL